MGYYRLDRTEIMRSTNGHSIQFVANAAVYVPPALEAEAVALGATFISPLHEVPTLDDLVNVSSVEAESKPVLKPVFKTVVKKHQ